MIRLIVCGAAGRMGARILELASADKHFKIVGAVESKGHPSVGKEFCGGKVQIT